MRDIRGRILLDEVIGSINVSLERCAEIAIRGEDFHEEWEKSQNLMVDLLGKLHHIPPPSLLDELRDRLDGVE